MPIHVDLNTRILARDHEVFFARPGKRYRIYPDIVAASTALIELPFLELDLNLPLAEQTNIIAKLKRSRALRNWHRAGRTFPEPSRSLQDYNNDGGDRSISQLLGTLRGYFEKAKQGDLIVSVPGPFSHDAMIGELTDPLPGYAELRVPRFFEGDLLPGRRVTWLASVQKRLLTGDILDIVEKPNIFVQLPASTRAGIYDRAYASYASYDQFSARFDVQSDQYRSYDDLILQAFFNFVASNTKAVAEQRFGDVVGFSAGAFRDAMEYTPDLRTNVNSPGFLTLASSHISPLVVAVMLSLAISVGGDAAMAAQQGMIVIGNSKAPAGDACTAEVARSALRQLEILGLNEWPAACERAREAAGHSRLRALMIVRP